MDFAAEISYTLDMLVGSNVSDIVTQEQNVIGDREAITAMIGVE